MQRPRLEQSTKEHYTAQGGLTLIGQAIALTRLEAELQRLPLRHGIAHADIVRSYLGLLAQAKTDFEAFTGARGDPFFAQALGIQRLPSVERLRQRMDEDAVELRQAVERASLHFLRDRQAPVTPLRTGHAALDLDLFPQDNSKSHKEGVSRTYKGHDGYGTFGAYLGQEGWNLAADLRPGKDHAQVGFIDLLREVVGKARQLTRLWLLARLDSAHDALENRVECVALDIDFILKWNPRRHDPQRWLDYATALGHWTDWTHPRPGKSVATFTVYEEQSYRGRLYIFRRVMRVIERTIDKKGQVLLLPEIEVEGWWTSLDCADREIIALYADHGTSEQFHSEFKTDLDLERLPSGKLATNRLIMAMGGFVYNLLRWIGLTGLLGPDAPVRHPAKRRRLRTVMQELIGLPARVLERSRYLVLRFGQHCPAFRAFCRVEAALNCGPSG